MTKLLSREPALDSVRQFGVFDDFERGLNTILWTTEQADSSTLAADADGVGGILIFTTGGTTDDQCSIFTTLELFKVAAEKPIFAICRLKLTEDTAMDATIAFGLADGIAADFLADTTGALPADMHGAIIRKGTGASVYDVSSTGTAKATASRNQTTTNASIGTGWETLAIEIEPVSGTDKRVTFYRDADGGQNWKQMQDSSGNLIKQTWSLADTAAATGEMSLVVSIKDGGSGAAQYLYLDYLGAWQLR